MLNTRYPLEKPSPYTIPIRLTNVLRMHLEHAEAGHGSDYDVAVAAINLMRQIEATIGPLRNHLVKFTLRRVRLNSQGYEASGTYWGTGAPLYRYEYEVGGSCEYDEIRADNREHAKELILARHPNATFNR